MATSNGNSKKTWDFGSIGMWVGQGVLAGLFLFAGGFKLMAPAEMMTEGPVVLPVLLLRFIGLCEVLGAVGLILPGVFRIHRELTPLAAAGLVIIMTGATVLTAIGGQIGGAVVPFIIGLVLITIGRGRWQRLRTV
jgi:DoxX-like family